MDGKLARMGYTVLIGLFYSFIGKTICCLKVIITKQSTEIPSIIPTKGGQTWGERVKLGAEL